MGEPRSNAKKRAVHTAETKAAALAALLAGQSVSEVASTYRLPVGTVKRWRAGLSPEEVAAIPPATKVEIGDLLVGYLRENLTTLQVQQTTLFRDEHWLRKQNAADMAVLHGVITDKAVRLLEALSNAGLDGDGDA